MSVPSHAIGSRSSVSLLGIPYDGNASLLRGAAQAPSRIREALQTESSNLWTEDGVDLGEPGTLHDAGDLVLSDEPQAAALAIESAVHAALDLGHPLICLGGDHSITFPIIRGFHHRHPDLNILHFDAHPDLYHDFGGNKFSHACQFARIMESGLARRLIQVGVRTINLHQAEQAAKFGVEIITMRQLARIPALGLEAPVFISFDVDVLDPAFAPGVSHPEPGGLSVRQALDIIQGLRVEIGGADLVEYNPACDRGQQTAMVCAKVLKELAAAILRGGAPPREGWP